MGHSVSIKTIYGQRDINIRAGVQHGTKYRLSGQGITKLAPHHDQRGDHIVVIKIVIPSSLSPSQKQIIEEYKAVESKLDPVINTRTSDEYERKSSSSNQE